MYHLSLYVRGVTYAMFVVIKISLQWNSMWLFPSKERYPSQGLF